MKYLAFKTKLESKQFIDISKDICVDQWSQVTLLRATTENGARLLGEIDEADKIYLIYGPTGNAIGCVKHAETLCSSGLHHGQKVTISRLVRDGSENIGSF
ncbi:MAG: hypothetical protein EOP04_10075 [Proteobacteria bacterium]|nr:MAG: hypothetical protein EOP04_10075 [Pseudomonadota bacterium]